MGKEKTTIRFHEFIIAEAIEDLRRDGLDDDEIAKLMLETINNVFRRKHEEEKKWAL